MTNGASQGDPIAMGQQRANEILTQREAVLARRAAILSAHPERLELNVQVANVAGPVAAASHRTLGFLIAAGDSWFDYPFYDVLKLLEDDHGYNVESAAHRGDPIESMAYQGGQLDKLARCLEKVIAQGGVPKAVLLSGGGDDIAGAEFGMLLNNATSAIHGWNSEIVDGVLNQRIAIAYRYMLAFITHLCVQKLGRSLPILVHGYDYPVPDGRGFLGGWPFPGPWLQPGFHEKLFDDLSTNVGLMRDILDRLNVMLAALVQEPAFSNVKYVDLRNTLSTVLAGSAYQDWWGNELHPTKQGFSAVTDKFARELASL
jgi:hypothetical protein